MVNDFVVWQFAAIILVNRAMNRCSFDIVFIGKFMVNDAVETLMFVVNNFGFRRIS